MDDEGVELAAATQVISLNRECFLKLKKMSFLINSSSTSPPELFWSRRYDTSYERELSRICHITSLISDCRIIVPPISECLGMQSSCIGNTHPWKKYLLREVIKFVYS